MSFSREPSWRGADRPLVIGIAGGSGSGKSTIARAIVDEIGDESTALILHDSYYRDLGHLPAEERARQNFDHPASLETERLASDLRLLIDGQSIEKPIYDFTTHARLAETETVEPRHVILIEGLLVLAEPGLRELMDLKIYVDTDADVRILRRLRRDLDERDRTLDSVIRQYLDTVRPMHRRFVEPSRAWADMVIPEGYNTGAVATVLAMIREFVRERARATERSEV